jgi:hypothetical protein
VLAPLGWVMFIKLPCKNLDDLHPRRDARSWSGFDPESNP